jgi:hypothetical protein
MFETEYQTYLESLRAGGVGIDSMSVLSIPDRRYDMVTDVQK